MYFNRDLSIFMYTRGIVIFIVRPLTSKRLFFCIMSLQYNIYIILLYTYYTYLLQQRKIRPTNYSYNSLTTGSSVRYRYK